MCKELFKITNGNFLFIANESISEERLSLGYHDMNSEYDFVLKAYESEEKYKLAKRLVFDADIVIYGGVGRKLISKRLKKGKIYSFLFFVIFQDISFQTRRQEWGGRIKSLVFPYSRNY